MGTQGAVVRGADLPVMGKLNLIITEQNSKSRFGDFAKKKVWTKIQGVFNDLHMHDEIFSLCKKSRKAISKLFSLYYYFVK